MIAHPLPAQHADAIARAVRALGTHRYVAGRLHLVHAFVFDAAGDEVDDLREACGWARAKLADPAIDPSSRDERLYRHATDRELAAALAAFWSGGDTAARARAALEARLATIDVHAPSETPFDEAAEEDLFPLLIDAGWELLPLAELDPDRHRGAIEALKAASGDEIGFEAAKFEEESAASRPAYLQELPAIGPVELLRASSDGALREPFIVWTEGPDAYHDYILRGVIRAAKLE
jgi:hypothetical protein